MGGWTIFNHYSTMLNCWIWLVKNIKLTFFQVKMKNMSIQFWNGPLFHQVYKWMFHALVPSNGMWQVPFPAPEPLIMRWCANTHLTIKMGDGHPFMQQAVWRIYPLIWYKIPGEIQHSNTPWIPRTKVDGLMMLSHSWAMLIHSHSWGFG